MNNPTQANEDQDDDFIEWAGPSKSQQKRDAHRLQNLGIELTKLNVELLATIPLPSELEKALLQAKSIKKNEALRRHHQLIGKLMRSVDAEAIIQALDKIKEKHDHETRIAQACERWRDNLIQGSQELMGQFIDQYPSIDRQQLRQLVKAAQSDFANNKTPVNARKLFKLIKQTLSLASDFE